MSILTPTAGRGGTLLLGAGVPVSGHSAEAVVVVVGFGFFFAAVEDEHALSRRAPARTTLVAVRVRRAFIFSVLLGDS